MALLGRWHIIRAHPLTGNPGRHGPVRARGPALVMAIRRQPQRTALRWAGFLAAIPNCYSEKTRSRKQPFVVTGKLHVLFSRTHELQG
jgi:hypothetical protein